MKLKIEIDLANAAFDVYSTPKAAFPELPSSRDRQEVRRILQDLQQRLPARLFTGDSWTLFDVNGNKVGVAVIVEP